ncbi:MAG: hypothetical protein IPJ78_19510 [Gemmatimonadetes bacterium]|nr:hypothetical protein [Gemmatimonadota bacterium]
MSVSVSVFLRAPQLPSRDEWQRAIDAAGFRVSLHREFNPTVDAGFVGALHDGRAAGFEFYLDVSAEDSIDGKEALTHRAMFVTHSALRELVSSVVAAATLASVCNGVLRDDDSGETYRGVAAIEYARNVELDCAAELQH